MEIREFTCVVCPNGCKIKVDLDDGEITAIRGAMCRRGESYVRQELIDPRRTISTSVAGDGGILPLASVRLTAPIPRDYIFDAMDEIRKLRLTAPVKAGTVLIHRLLGFDSDLIVTKDVPAV